MAGFQMNICQKKKNKTKHTIKLLLHLYNIYVCVYIQTVQARFKLWTSTEDDKSYNMVTNPQTVQMSTCLQH